MPTYQYRCADCGHEFDQFQKFAEATLTVCPNCGGAIRRVIQPAAVVFKGSGWYITDSRSTGTTTSKDKSDKTEKPAATAAPAEGGDKPKTESAPKSEPAATTPAPAEKKSAAAS